jgi:hypothetical protein
MPTLKAFEQIDSGGVDSRSNPINFPRNRALRCLNWCPRQGGWWELRYGYSTVTMSTVTASAISGMFPYRQWGGNRYTIFMQGTTWKVLNNATGTVTTPTVLSAAIASSAKGNGYFANNRFHYGNGTDQKWFDGTNWRDSGLPTPAAEAALDPPFTSIVQSVGEGIRELKPSEASAVTLTPAAGGSFPTTNTGVFFYVALFQPGTGEIGPATISVGSGIVNTTTGQKVTVAVLPNTSSFAGFSKNAIKLIAGTMDGGGGAYFFTNTSTNITSCTWSSGATTLTVVATAHGLSTNDVVILAGTGANDAVYGITVIDANTFKAVVVSIGNTQSAAQGNITPNASTGAVGTVKRIVSAAAATTSVDVLALTQDTSYQVNQNRGIAASTIGSSNAGYQIAISIYNPTSGHIGNYTVINTRFLQTAYRCNVYVGIPAYNPISQTEWMVLVGRTGDGALIPYPVTDPNGNLLYSLNTQTQIVITQGNLDTRPMPTRNGIIPAQSSMFCVAGDFCYAADPGSPYLRRSGDLSQAVERGNTVLGRPEQSWAPNDIDTFPTGEASTAIFEVDQEVFMGTLHDCALSVNLAGIQQWNGPWAVGIAGPRAGTKCGANGFYWMTGDKQLATFIQGVPTIVSDEYELAELSQFGNATISTVECVYIRNPAIGKEELRIEGQLSDGAPYTVIHDFKLRAPYEAPGSIYGQGYSSQFQGPLNTVFTSTLVRDGSGQLQIYAGASNGQIYQLYSGADDVANQYASDLILLVNGGPDRPQVPFIDFYGDQNVKITVGRNLSTSLASGAAWGFDPPSADADQPEAVPGAEQDFLYRVPLTPPEVQRLYIRFQLSSHSADGNLALNSPPHIPLESYGRLYELIPAVDGERER